MKPITQGHVEEIEELVSAGQARCPCARPDECAYCTRRAEILALVSSLESAEVVVVKREEIVALHRLAVELELHGEQPAARPGTLAHYVAIATVVRSGIADIRRRIADLLPSTGPRVLPPHRSGAGLTRPSGEVEK
jgi:hypothetical protein